MLVSLLLTPTIPHLSAVLTYYHEYHAFGPQMNNASLSGSRSFNATGYSHGVEVQGLGSLRQGQSFYGAGGNSANLDGLQIGLKLTLNADNGFHLNDSLVTLQELASVDGSILTNLTTLFSTNIEPHFNASLICNSLPMGQFTQDLSMDSLPSGSPFASTTKLDCNTSSSTMRNGQGSAYSTLTLERIFDVTVNSKRKSIVLNTTINGGLVFSDVTTFGSMGAGTLALSPAEDVLFILPIVGALTLQARRRRDAGSGDIQQMRDDERPGTHALTNLSDL